jgi:hypothetical protein
VIPDTLTITITAETVAWYGAIVATLALGATLVNLWLDRERIRVEARVGWKMIGGPYKSDKRYIVITVSNWGRRPRTIDRVGFTYRTPERSQPS